MVQARSEGILDLDVATEEPQAVAVRPPWKILVVDDDADVHESTAYALHGLEIESRGLQLLHAYSGREALALLRQHRDVAVLLLDVVMESDDAGLAAVGTIRDELGLRNLRIILRTGQAGQAPELDTIRRYDINDYKTKSELSRVRLYTSLVVAVRGYDQLVRLDTSRQGLEQIITGSHQLISEQGVRVFAEGVITQIAALVGVEPQGLVCAASQVDAAGARYAVIAAAGPLAPLMDRDLADIEDTRIAGSLARCLSERRNQRGPHNITLFFSGRDGNDFAAYLHTRQPLLEVDMHLLEVFCTHLALCAAHVGLVRRLREQTFVDRLVELPNRAAFIAHIDATLRNGAAQGQVVALLDIDDFAEANDTLGQVYGDLLLGAIARRLKQSLPGTVTVARMGGDVFGVFGDAAQVQPENLRALFAQPYEVAGVQRLVSLCLGFARCDDPAAGGQALCKNAAIALKRAKRAGQGQALYFTPEVGVSARERAQLLHGLRRGFRAQQLSLVYQPQITFGSQRTVGVEALLRWKPEGGQDISPARFIPVAEQSGLIVPIGAWVLRTALDALARLRAQGARVRMAVNVSPLQFTQPDFLGVLDAALQGSGVPPDGLELEITESVAIMGLERAVELLKQLRARGIAIAIDDFGTGFSSLSYLERLPVDRLKIDRSFVRALDSGGAGERIAELIVPLGQRLGLSVLAEGVETAEQARVLQALGCDEAQGFLYARPMHLEALEPWLAAARKADR